MKRRLGRVPDSAALDAPIVWSTQIVSAQTDVPVAGADVVAYVNTATKRSANDPGLVPVARAVSGADGWVSLRLDPATVSKYVTAEQLTLWYVLSDGGDFTMWSDTVYVPRAGDGWWPTSTSQHERARTASATGSAAVAPASTAASPELVAADELSDRPLRMAVDSASAQPRALTAAAAPTPETLCSVSNDFGITIRPVTVGTLYLDELWTSTFTYKNTTVYQTQWNASASVSVPIKNSGLNLSFGIGGTIAVSETVDPTGGTAAVGRATTTGQKLGYKVRVQFEFRNQEWKCGYSTTPIYNYKLVVFPVRARMDLPRADSSSTAIPTCSTKVRLVASGREYFRQSGSSTTDYGAEYSFGVSYLGVGGSVAAQSSTTYSTSTQQFWVNNSTSDRYLCSAGDITGTATVVATSLK